VSRGTSIALGVGAAVFVGCWVMIHNWFWGHGAIVDTPIYERYGSAMRAGQLPYRDFAVEYPPGALPAFVAPAFSRAYDSVFGWLMAACGLGCLVFAALARPPARALAFVALSPLLIGSTVFSRFDLWPALFVTAAVAAFVHDRHLLGWAALGAAFAIKLYAVVLVPLAVVWTLRRRGARELWHGVAAAAAVVAAAFLPFAIAAPRGLWDSFWNQTKRPLQIETLAASVVTTFGHARVVWSYGSQNLVGEGALAAASTALEVLVLVLLWVGFARGPAERERFLRYAGGAVCAFIVFGKVLSPQYLIWLVPLVPLLRGRRGLAATALLAAALVATQVYFPWSYFEYVDTFHLAWVVLARNLLLVALLAVLTLPARAAPHSS
jgi:uncharacterized membrane protein